MLREPAVVAPPALFGVQIRHGEAGSGPTPALVEAAGRDGFDGITLALPSAGEGLTAAEAASIGAAAATSGLRVEVVLGRIGPSRDPGSVVEPLAQRLAAAQALGAVEAAVYTTTDRRGSSPSHRQQLDSIVGALRELAGRAVDVGIHLNLKTHEDLSSHEVLRVVEAVDDAPGSSPVGVALDVANLVVRGEDPVEATRRLAPWVCQTHLEDVAMYPVDGGLRRRLVPCGQGVLDWEAMLDPLLARSSARQLTLEQHRGRFDVRITDPDWYASEPHVTDAGIAALTRMGEATEAARIAGRLPGLDAYETERTVGEELRDAQVGATFLRSILARQKEIHS